MSVRKVFTTIECFRRRQSFRYLGGKIMRKSSLLLTLALTVSVGLLSACGSDTASKNR